MKKLSDIEINKEVKIKKIDCSRQCEKKNSRLRND